MSLVWQGCGSERGEADRTMDGRYVIRYFETRGTAPDGTKWTPQIYALFVLTSDDSGKPRWELICQLGAADLCRVAAAARNIADFQE